MSSYIGVESSYDTTQDVQFVYTRSPFGECLRALRTERGLSQEKLCKMINVNRNFVTSVEGGKQNICIDNILQLARALKVNPRDLFDLYKK